MSEEARSKITSPALQRLLDDPSLPAATVLVELDVGAPSVGVERDPAGSRAVSLDDETPDDAPVADEARAFLEGLVAQPVTYLRAAQAFVVEAGGRELEAICRQRFVRAVHPNRAIR